MTVKFRDPIGAQACVIVRVRTQYDLHILTHSQKMNGRFFAGRRIEASLYAGKQRFKRSGAGEEIEGAVLLNFKEMQTTPLENVSVYFEGSVFTCVPSVL